MSVHLHFANYSFFFHFLSMSVLDLRLRRLIDIARNLQLWLWTFCEWFSIPVLLVLLQQPVLIFPTYDLTCKVCFFGLLNVILQWN